MGVALYWLLYHHLSITTSIQERKVKKTFTRVKHGISAPLIRASIKLPY